MTTTQKQHPAVITSTIGRPELRQCIESVKNQTLPTEHFVFVNGKKYHDSARSVLNDYPCVHAIYLPHETGDYGMGPTMAGVFAAAPFLISSDWLFFLDDDNFFDKNHVVSLIKLAEDNDLKWAFSLRRYVDKLGTPICNDDWCSLGYWSMTGGAMLVDNSCYMVNKRLAETKGLAWTAVPFFSDRAFLMALKNTNTRSGCTGLSTVNYRIGTGTADPDPELYLKNAEKIKTTLKNVFPWRCKNIFQNSSNT